MSSIDPLLRMDAYRQPIRRLRESHSKQRSKVSLNTLSQWNTNSISCMIDVAAAMSEAKAAEEGIKVGEESGEPAKDNIQATIYGVGFVFLLAVGLFTLQGNAAEPKEKH